MGRFVVTFTGRSSIGPVTITGLEVGDQAVAIMDATGNAGPPFAAFVIVDAELLQISSTDLSANTYHALIERHVIVD